MSLWNSDLSKDGDDEMSQEKACDLRRIFQIKLMVVTQMMKWTRVLSLSTSLMPQLDDSMIEEPHYMVAMVAISLVMVQQLYATWN